MSNNLLYHNYIFLLVS